MLVVLAVAVAAVAGVAVVLLLLSLLLLLLYTGFAGASPLRAFGPPPPLRETIHTDTQKTKQIKETQNKRHNQRHKIKHSAKQLEKEKCTTKIQHKTATMPPNHH